MGRITSPDLFAILCLTQSRIPLSFLATKAHYWLMFNLVSTRTPWSFPTMLLSSWVAPSMSWCLGLFSPRCRTLYFLLNFTIFLSAHLSSLSRSLWMSVLPFVESAISLRFVHSTNLLRLHSTLPSRSLMKVLNRTGPSIDTLYDDELKLKWSWLMFWDSHGMQHQKYKQTLVSSIQFSGCKSNLSLRPLVIS